MARTRVQATAAGWPRWRLLVTLAGVALTAVALLTGFALAVLAALAPATAEAPTQSTQEPASRELRRDLIAAAPMVKVPASAAYTPNVAASLSPSMSIPSSTSMGPAGVRSGFPRTPQGAVAQLAAIEVRVLESMSIPLAHEVHAAWALPGGPGASDWEMTRNVQAFLTSAGGQDSAKDDTIFVAATPAAGQVKGTDGPEWVLACVLLDVRATIVTDARIGYGHCERMQWLDQRWMIAPGTPAVAAPSVWPGSDLAVEAGWLTWSGAGG